MAKDYRIVEAMTMTPATHLKFAGTNGPYFDTRIDLYGTHIYVSRGQANEIALAFGYITGDDHAEALKENARLSAENAKLRDAMETPWAEMYDFATEKARIELERAQAAETAPVA